MHIKKGDNVMVISGKEKGKKGKVLLVSRGTNRAIIEALNMMAHHERPSRRNPQGGIVRREAPIHVSNLMVICAKCGKPTRVGGKALEDGSKVRVCKKCSEIIDLG
ncbi:MAG: 50S ribosomal protein L24 [Candidatus Lindowbacteria bacterium]|nr:50S ribosomal protein L24 [Candidatus Lindowbacteria bacterium]